MNHCSGAFGSSMSQHSCIGCQGTSHESASSHFVGGTGTTYVTPRVFDTMSNHTYPPHDPSYHQPTHNSTYPPPYYPSYPHPHCFTQTLYPHSTPPTYGYEHQTPIQSSCKQGGSTILSEQHLDGLPHHYGFDNLTRQSVFLADGSEHSFYALPEDYPLEQSTPPMSPPAEKNVGVTVAPSVAAQAAGLAPVLCSQANSTAGSELLVPNLQQPMNVQDASCVFKETPVYDIYEKDSFCLNTTSDEQVSSLELQQQEEERAYNCSDLKVSDSVVTGSSQLSIEHSKRESRLLWDPRASLPFISRKTQHPGQVLQLATHATTLAFSSVTSFSRCKCLPFCSQDNSCVYNASDNAVSGVATDFTFPHGPAIHADRSSNLTHEKSTQALSILCVQEATVHWDDEGFDINIKKQNVLINKHCIIYPYDLNTDKKVPIALQYQLPLSNAPCIWDPGIDLFSYKQLHLVSWIPLSDILLLQQLHNKIISYMWEFSLGKGQQVQWDPEMQGNEFSALLA